MNSLADLRKDYTKATLDVTSVAADPLAQFQHWLDEAIASQVHEPTAFHLATVTAAGTPASRVILLKGVEQGRLVFFTNYQSDKGQQLDAQPACAMSFFWPELERQVRVEGIAERIDVAASETYFKSRPRGSQIGAWASPQSSIISGREVLEARVAEMEKRFEGQELLPKPHQWGGFAVTPHKIEFWQGRASRLHDRILFTKIDGAWAINRLAP